ncbi:DUF4476 domain-containing protein [Bernardetia sp. OM2101]|uniref:DUF4476 domain-containing protein n=1 Tax=Bernardetia sp. OM2101 TaxID=3344876 RepID=UPI0035D09975
MNYSSLHYLFLSLFVVFGLFACEGSGKIHGETSGRFEMTSDYSYEETKNGEVVATKESHNKKGGAFEDEFDVEFGNSSSSSQTLDDLDTKEELEAKISTKNLKHELNCTSSLNPDRFENIKAVIEDEFIDKNKLKLAKQLINNECLTAYQVANIMELMTMDKYKVEFAKFAFGRTIDKDNFRTVKETLSFSSSKKQIESLLQRR